LSLTRTFCGIFLKITLMLAALSAAMAVAPAAALSGAESAALSGAESAAWAAGPARTAGPPGRLTHLAGSAAARPSGSGFLRPARPARVTRAVSGSPGTAAPAAAAAPRYRTPQQIARSLLRRFHWGHRQFWFLNLLWARESGWDRHASNPNSGAYGIPQAVPGSKMASAGRDWKSNAATQILWGMGYIEGRYRTPYRAWRQECLYGWY
jgi:hypothetical protein